MVRSSPWDVAGVLYVDYRPIDGEPRALSKLREVPLPMPAFTNFAKKSEKAILRRHARFSIEADETEVLSLTSTPMDQRTSARKITISLQRLLMHGALLQMKTARGGRMHLAPLTKTPTIQNGTMLRGFGI